MNIFKKLFVPSGEQKELTALENWTVRWDSRYDDYSYSIKPEAEVFTSKEDAIEFKKAVENAFKLLKYKGESTKVTIQKTK